VFSFLSIFSPNCCHSSVAPIDDLSAKKKIRTKRVVHLGAGPRATDSNSKARTSSSAGLDGSGKPKNSRQTEDEEILDDA